MGFSEILTLSNRPVVRVLSLVILFTAFTHFQPLTVSIVDHDIWWHLRGGDTILAQHTFPHHGVFTQHTERPWIEYSWGFEIIISRLYHWFGLMGILALRLCFVVLISAILFAILYRELGHFWWAWLLTALGMWLIQHCLGTRPMLFSIAIFAVEIGVLFEALRKARIGLLWLLPPLFVLWANLHIQFLYGIIVLGLLTLTTLFHAVFPARWTSWFETPRLRFAEVVGVLGLSILGTLIGPYSWHLYGVIHDYAQSSVPYSLIMELQALNFREPSHFVLVLLVSAAFLALGWRHSRDPFKFLLMVACTVIGLRMSRDSWVACIPALAIIADREVPWAMPTVRTWRGPLAFVGATAAATVATLAVVVWDTRTDNALLDKVVELNFPTKACEFIRSHSLPGPLYNAANWGGFLTWALPEKPVAIDNRTDLYGDELTERSYIVQHAEIDWRSDPDLKVAQVILLSRDLQLATALYQDKHFRLVYYDNLAVVFTRNDASLSASASYRPATP